MDEPTSTYYEKAQNSTPAAYMAAADLMKARLSAHFRAGMRVLDIGSGSGRDIGLLLDLGCDAFGVEPSNAMREWSIRNDPRLLCRIVQGALPLDDSPFDDRFDAITCTAVLMHLVQAEQLDAAISMRNLLRPNGILLLSFPLDRPGLDTENRDPYGRLFTPLNPDEIQLLYERIGFFLEERIEEEDSLGRKDHQWQVMRFRLKHIAGSRPIDQIEGILNRDKKTATYKLALFRALAEIATTEFGQAKWLNGGKVGIPVNVVAMKWMEYYWPILSAREFVPQIRGEDPNKGKPIAFRPLLTELISQYDGMGGLSRFSLDQRTGTLPSGAVALYKTALRKISDTIIAGPVTYSGGSLEGGRIFEYDKEMKFILVPSSIWLELSMMGHWVEDAVILRWAELTSDITKGVIRPSQVIDLLLERPVSERDVLEARNFYEKLPDLECVWTGQPIKHKYAVDHVIPFSLWHNNGLWNLLPAAEKVNASKSDKLPTRALLVKRKAAMAHYWQLLYKTNKIRFQNEAVNLMGNMASNQNWETDLFSAVSASIEYTANQRGIERWEP